MAHPETLLAQAGRLLDIASHCPTLEMTQTMMSIAREFIDLAHREAQVCSFPLLCINVKGTRGK